jgi:hypothetical protein
MTWSDDSIAGGAGNVAYVTSKNAVLGLTRTAAVEGGERGIRVNAVCPGAVEGRMMRSIDDQRLSTTAAPARNPLCRRAHPEEIADTVAFLLSEQAGTRCRRRQARAASGNVGYGRGLPPSTCARTRVEQADQQHAESGETERRRGMLAGVRPIAQQCGQHETGPARDEAGDRSVAGEVRVSAFGDAAREVRKCGSALPPSKPARKLSTIVCHMDNSLTFASGGRAVGAAPRRRDAG